MFWVQETLTMMCLFAQYTMIPICKRKACGPLEAGLVIMHGNLVLHQTQMTEGKPAENS